MTTLTFMYKSIDDTFGAVQYMGTQDERFACINLTRELPGPEGKFFILVDDKDNHLMFVSSEGIRREVHVGDYICRHTQISNRYFILHPEVFDILNPRLEDEED